MFKILFLAVIKLSFKLKIQEEGDFFFLRNNIEEEILKKNEIFKEKQNIQDMA